MTDWRQTLGDFLDKDEKAKKKAESGSDFTRFIGAIVLPAFESLREELTKRGRTVTIRHTDTSAAIIVQHNGDEELTYRIQGRTFPTGVLPYAEVRFKERKGLKIIRVESMFRSGAPDYRMADVSADEIIGNFLEHYMKRAESD